MLDALVFVFDCGFLSFLSVNLTGLTIYLFLELYLVLIFVFGNLNVFYAFLLNEISLAFALVVRETLGMPIYKSFRARFACALYCVGNASFVSAESLGIRIVSLGLIFGILDETEAFCFANN